MVRAVFSLHGALPSNEEFGLIGLNDLEVVYGAGGPKLFAATRGDGWLTAYTLGNTPGATTLAQHWQIGPELLQLETTDLVLRDVGGIQHLFMAGLKSNTLNGVQLDSDGAGSAIDAAISFSASGQDLGSLSEMELFKGGSTGLGALRFGGLVDIGLNANNTVTLSPIDQGPLLQGERANGIVTATHDGQSYAFVTYQAQDSVSMFKQGANGKMQHINDVDASAGFWVDRPGAVTVTSSADGALYVVVAGSGSDSLTTFSDGPYGLVPVDHLIDSRDTRFADASHVTSLKVGDHNFVLAAGSDTGISLFTMLPGGRLQHIQAMPASVDTPLRGITALEAMAVPDGIRIWVSTEAAPYLAELSVALPDLGVNLGANASGSILTGSAGDDVLAGAAGPDQLNGGAGGDILMDGAHSDVLRGDTGADTFILVEDGAKDVIADFELGIDRLDLTDYSQINGMGGMTIRVRPWGAEITIGAEVLEVRSSDGSRLPSNVFDSTNLLTGNRILTDPGVYPGGSGFVRPDPNPGLTENPSRVDPNTLRPTWINEPNFALSRREGDFIGTSAADMLASAGQNDRLFAGSGNDTIRSGAGADSVTGEGGNDQIEGEAGNDFLFGGAGFDTITGDDGDDTILGDSFADALDGGRGNDIILGGDGFDRIIGGDGDDMVWAGASPDRIFGGEGNDWLSAGKNFGFSVDGVFGEAGNDTLFGNAGFDLLNGGDGDDVLDGGHQSDNLYGEAGNDTLLGDEGFDRLFGGTGDDFLYGGAAGDGVFGQQGNDRLWGGEGGDRFFGGQGNDVVDGGSGTDTIYAGAGFDTIIGGTEDDLIYGGFNADTFIFPDGHGNDTIMDFDALNAKEVIDFSNLNGLSRFSDVLSVASQSGQDVTIATGTGSSIRLRNVELDDLDESDFDF